MLLDAATLSRIAGLKLRARAVVEGVLSGQHKSPHQGQSVEFAEHKEYAPGDELRHLDWKAFGKFDKYYVKRFEHETNLRAVMVVDTSGSMGFGTTGLSKLDVARVMAATLAHLLVRQQDAAGVALVAAGRFAEVPPRAAATHLQVVLEALESAQASAIGAALKKRFDRDIEIDAKVDPSVLGGAVINAAGLVIDASVRGRLERLAQDLSH